MPKSKKKLNESKTKEIIKNLLKKSEYEVIKCHKCKKIVGIIEKNTEFDISDPYDLVNIYCSKCYNNIYGRYIYDKKDSYGVNKTKQKEENRMKKIFNQIYGLNSKH